MERYQQAGGGIVAIHNSADMRGNYEWWDDLIGSLMPGHAATGTSPGQPGQVIVEDQTHPSTAHLDGRWARADEWYNFSTNVRGDAHVLATMDETTYDPGGNAMGYDHPISWCKPYDGGRAWVTAMGHFGAHYSEPAFMQHIVGGVAWAAGVAPGDCGGTRNDSFEKVALDENTSAPFALDVAPDGRVFFTELVRGQIRVYDPQSPDGQDRAHARRLLRRRGRPARHRRRARLRDHRPSLRLLLARLGEQLRPRELQEPHLALHRRRELRHRPRLGGADHRGAGQPRARRARPHGRRPRLRPAGQPAARRRRRRQPALRALRRLRAAVGAARHLPRRARDVGQHQRPARQAAAHHARRRRRLHDPRGQPVPAGDRADPARDLRDGLPQPVPLLGRPEHGLDRPRRLRARLRRRAPGRPRPRGHRRVEPDQDAGQLRLAALHRPQRAVPRRRLPHEPGHRRRLLRLREPGQRLGPQHRPDQPAARARARDVLRLHAVVGPGGDPCGRRPGADGRPVLRLRPGVGRPTSSSPSTSRASRSSTSGRRTGSTR